MNLKKIILSAALVGGVFSASAFATTVDAHAAVTKAVAYEAPVVTKMVSPTGLSRQLEGAVVRISLNVDANGQPSNIQVVSRDSSSSDRLVAAVSKWQFTPAKKNGVAVPSKIVVPVELVESNS